MDTENLKWWVRNRDRVILGTFLVLILGLMGIIPGPISAMRDEHKALLKIEQINCYNNADLVPDLEMRRIHQKRCLTMTLDE